MRMKKTIFKERDRPIAGTARKAGNDKNLLAVYLFRVPGHVFACAPIFIDIEFINCRAPQYASGPECALRLSLLLEFALAHLSPVPTLSHLRRLSGDVCDIFSRVVATGCR